MLVLTVTVGVAMWVVGRVVVWALGLAVEAAEGVVDALLDDVQQGRVRSERAAVGVRHARVTHLLAQ
jgi:hypothetical protein